MVYPVTQQQENGSTEIHKASNQYHKTLTTAHQPIM
jgi:hypothetical protein